MPVISVTKCQGSGNDFVLVDAARVNPSRYADLARSLCDRRFCIGADGMIALSLRGHEPCVDARVFNADGSEAETCGNGVRCVARYFFERIDSDARVVDIGVPAGRMRAELSEGHGIRVCMGSMSRCLAAPAVQRFGSIAGERFDVGIGNLHRVVFIGEDPAVIDLESFARHARAHDPAPGGINVEVARVRDGIMEMRVHERGAGETWACGSGACAVAIAAIRSGKAASPVAVSMRGGAVTVEWAGDAAPVYLTGPADIVFDADVVVPQEFVSLAHSAR